MADSYYFRSFGLVQRLFVKCSGCDHMYGHEKKSAVCERYTDGAVTGSLHTQRRERFKLEPRDVGVVASGRVTCVVL